jgi:hypothetical protein
MIPDTFTPYRFDTLARAPGASLFVPLFFLAACASSSGVVPIGKDTYMLSRQAASGFSGTGNLKADALREANQYCASLNKSVQVVSTHEAQPPYILGNFPKAEVQFMCVTTGAK